MRHRAVRQRKPRDPVPPAIRKFDQIAVDAERLPLIAFGGDQRIIGAVINDIAIAVFRQPLTKTVSAKHADQFGVAAHGACDSAAVPPLPTSTQPNVTREEKIFFLRSLTLFSVPTLYEEAFGLYVVEAMACGIPVVQPDSAAFPEIIRATGGGLCVAPKDPAALARAWRDLLADPARRAALGRAGRLGVEKLFSAPSMSAQFSLIAARLTGPAK